MISAKQLADAEAHGHSLFGASGWSRKLACAGSLAAEIGLPDTSGYEAAEGTVAHAVAESLLRKNPNAHLWRDEVVEQGKYEIRVTPLMLEYVQQYVDWCEEAPGVKFVEQIVDLSPWTPIPNQKGTADHIAMEPGHLTITDLKYGTGVKVYAKDNPQAIGYALGVIAEWQEIFGFERVAIRICQPRLGHFDVWETTVAELQAIGDKIREGLAKCWVPNAPRNPSESACKFCRARVVCPALIAEGERLADSYFEDETIGASEMANAVERLAAPIELLPSVKSLSTGQIEQFLKWQKLFESTFKDARAELQRRANLGEKLQNWMIAEGKKSRTVKCRAGIREVMNRYGVDAADLYEVSFLSAARCEELLVKKGKVRKADAVRLLEPHIDVLPGEPVLALIGPGKKAAVDLADDTFVDETKPGQAANVDISDL